MTLEYKCLQFNMAFRGKENIKVTSHKVSEDCDVWGQGWGKGWYVNYLNRYAWHHTS